MSSPVIASGFFGNLPLLSCWSSKRYTLNCCYERISLMSEHRVDQLFSFSFSKYAFLLDFFTVILNKSRCHLVILSSSHLVILSSCHLVILSSSHLVILSSCHLVILSSCYPGILSSCHPVILSSCYPVILSSCHLVYLAVKSSSVMF